MSKAIYAESQRHSKAERRDTGKHAFCVVRKHSISSLFPLASVLPQARVRLSRGRLRLPVALSALPPASAAATLPHARPAHVGPCALPCTSSHRFYHMMSFLSKWPLDVTVSPPRDSHTDTFLWLEILGRIGVLKDKKDRASRPAPGQLFEASLIERTGDTGAPEDKQVPCYTRGDTAALRLLNEPQ